MLKKQTITTEEYNSTGDLTRRIVEENEYSEDTPLQVSCQMPCTPGDTTSVKPWWQYADCNNTVPIVPCPDGVTVTYNNKENDTE